jgi:hypothetical protein
MQLLLCILTIGIHWVIRIFHIVYDSANIASLQSRKLARRLGHRYLSFTNLPSSNTDYLSPKLSSIRYDKSQQRQDLYPSFTNLPSSNTEGLQPNLNVYGCYYICLQNVRIQFCALCEDIPDAWQNLWEVAGHGLGVALQYACQCLQHNTLFCQHCQKSKHASYCKHYKSKHNAPYCKKSQVKTKHFILQTLRQNKTLHTANTSSKDTLHSASSSSNQLQFLRS